MKYKITAIVGAALLTAAVTLPAAAHHAFGSEFDPNRPILLKGKVVKVEWQNPHIWIYVDGKDEVTGRAAVWGFSAGPPATLSRRGINKDFLKKGDTVKIDGFLAKDGSPNGSGGTVTFPDGRSVFTASAEDPAPTNKK